jgi:hypothetical protein
LIELELTLDGLDGFHAVKFCWRERRTLRSGVESAADSSIRRASTHSFRD